MNLKNPLKWTGLGLGILLFVGIVAFAQKGVDVFSKEHFRSPQFLLRDPSLEDRPMVEVVSTPVEGLDEAVAKSLADDPEAFKKEMAPTEAPLPGVDLSSVGTDSDPSSASNTKQKVPERITVDEFRSVSWEVPAWIPYYRDQQTMQIRVPDAEAVKIVENVDRIQPIDIAPPVIQNTVIPSSPPVQNQTALSFRDLSGRSLFLRTQPLNRPSQNLVPTEMSQKPIDEWVQMSESELKENIYSTTDGEFKDRRVLNSSTNQVEISDLSKKEEEEKVALSKTQQNQKEELARPQVDRRFSVVEKSNSTLYSDQGRKRLYEKGYRVGQFDVRANLENQVSYTDNLTLRSKNEKKESTVSVRTAPSVEFAGGEKDAEVTDALYSAFRYTPLITKFIDGNNEGSSTSSSSSNRETIVDHSVSFNAGYRFSRLSLNLDQQVDGYSGGDVEAADFISRKFYTTTVSGEYQYSEKISLDGYASSLIRSFERGFDSEQYSLRGFINYGYSDKLKLGIGSGGSKLFTKGGSNQDAYQGLLRAFYVHSPKSSFFIELGGENRVFERNSSQLNALFRTGFSYELTPRTILNMNSSRGETSSGFNFGKNANTTGVAVGLTHTIHKLGISMGAGYDYIDYNNNIKDLQKVNSNDPNQDFFYSLRSGFRYEVTDWWDMGVDYTYRFKETDTGTQEFQVNQIDFNSKIRF